MKKRLAALAATIFILACALPVGSVAVSPTRTPVSTACAFANGESGIAAAAARTTAVWSAPGGTDAKKLSTFQSGAAFNVVDLVDGYFAIKFDDGVIGYTPTRNLKMTFLIPLTGKAGKKFSAVALWDGKVKPFTSAMEYNVIGCDGGRWIIKTDDGLKYYVNESDMALRDYTYLYS